MSNLRSTGPATANFPRSPASSRCCRSTGGKAPMRRGASATSRRRRWRFRWGLRPIVSGSLKPAARWCWNGSRITGGRIFRTASARIISTSFGLNSFATTRLGSRPSRPIRWTGLPSAAASNGRRPTISPPSAKNASSRKNFPMRVRGTCKASRSICAGQYLRMSGSAAHSIMPMIGRSRTGSSRTESTIATAVISTASPNSPRRDFPRVRSCRFSKRCATRCLPRSLRRRTKIRSAAIRKPLATICAKPRGF